MRFTRNILHKHSSHIQLTFFTMTPLRIRLRALPFAFLSVALAACTPTSAAHVETGLPVSGTFEQQLDLTMGLQREPGLVALLADISPARIRETDSVLVSFGTRHAMSDTISATRGVGAARRFLYNKLQGISRDCGNCLRVEYDPGMVEVTRHPQKPSVNIVNVLAWLPGRDTSRVIVIGGHYDSCVCNLDRFDVTTDAPGADDDGSGSSAVVEMARAFSKRYPHGLESTIIFALYSGEELGLLGSTHFAQRLHDQHYKVVAAVTNDMDGNVSTEDGRVDSTTVRIYGADPDNGPSRELARYAWASGELYNPAFAVLPVFRLDRISRGGDHSPFVTLKDPGIRFSERLENYKRQHLPGDKMEFVNFGYVANVARLNAATLGALASAPPVPDSVTAKRDAPSGGQKWMLAWKPAPGAVSYEVLVRRTTSPTYEKVIPVRGATSYLLADQLDDLWASVRSVGANGQRSLAVVVPPPTFVTR